MVIVITGRGENFRLDFRFDMLIYFFLSFFNVDFVIEGDVLNEVIILLYQVGKYFDVLKQGKCYRAVVVSIYVNVIRQLVVIRFDLW